MSDAPLFQNTDDQEVAYAPQELPRGSGGETRAAVDDANKGSGNQADDAVIPVVGGSVMTGTGGVGSVGMAGSGANPAIGAAAINATTDDRENLPDRDV